MSAAGTLRPATLELGGKSALIVFEDADLEKAVEWAMFGCFWTGGQICSATSRLLVHESVAPAFLAHLKKRAEAIQVSGCVCLRTYMHANVCMCRCVSEPGV